MRSYSILIGGVILLTSALGCESDPAPAPVEEAPCPEVLACEATPGNICTVAGTCRSGWSPDGFPGLETAFSLPQDMAEGPDGKIYVLDWNNHRVRSLDADGIVETVVGSGSLGPAADGPASTANLNHPTHITFSPEGKMIISAWHNSKLVEVDLEEDTLKAVCGTGARAYSGDGGQASKAELDLPVASSFDPEGRLVFMDQANQRIRRITFGATEEETTIEMVMGALKWPPDGYSKFCPTAEQDPTANPTLCKFCTTQEEFDKSFKGEPADCKPPKPLGISGEGVDALGAMMCQSFAQSTRPAGRLQVAADGTIYFCDTFAHRIRKVTTDGKVETIAGIAPETCSPLGDIPGAYSGDGGDALDAELNTPTDLEVADDGTIYVADNENHCIRKIDPDGIITTFAGKCGERGFAGDGGAATSALLDRPYGVALDSKGNLWIADTHNHRLRVVYAP